jgi:hypothetical protein
VARTLADTMDEIGVCWPRQMYFHPGSLPGGVYAYLKTRFALRYSRAQLVGTHWTVWEAHPDLVASFREDGFTLTTYGGSEEVLESSGVFEAIDVVNVETPGDRELKGDNHRPDGVRYQPNPATYRRLVGGTVLAGLSLVGVIAIPVAALRRRRRLRVGSLDGKGP